MATNGKFYPELRQKAFPMLGGIAYIFYLIQNKIFSRSLLLEFLNNFNNKSRLWKFERNSNPQTAKVQLNNKKYWYQQGNVKVIRRVFAPVFPAVR